MDVPVYLLVAAIILWLDRSMADGCGPDEYYDGVFDNCTSCKTICLCEPLSQHNHDYCMKFPKCADYYRRLCTTVAGTSSSTRRIPIPPRFPPATSEQSPPAAEGLPQRTYERPDLSAHSDYNTVSNPLLWLAISCIFLAILAILIVSGVMFYYMRASRERYTDTPLLRGGQPAYSRSTSQLSSSSCANSQQQERKCTLAIIRESDQMIQPDIQKVHFESGR